MDHKVAENECRLRMKAMAAGDSNYVENQYFKKLFNEKVPRFPAVV